MALLLLALIYVGGLPYPAGANEDVRILFLTDCKVYSDWQAVAMAFSYQLTEQQGAIVRVMCCTDEEQHAYNHDLLDLMPTYIAESYAWNAELKDWYAAYNKPGAVVDYLSHVTPSEKWLLVIDSDMLLLKPFHVRDYNLSKGWILSADYTYLKGVTNELWTRHIPEVAARNDTLAGPYGRHADQVGGYFLAHRDDMTRMAPMWLQITKDVRADPEAWQLTGDTHVAKGDRPWISEMYGYVFAAAKADVWHKWEVTTMHYPNYIPLGIPKLNHYGLEMIVDDYKWDKHWHFHFDIRKCPPWTIHADPKERQDGIFGPPPHPSTLKTRTGATKWEYYRDLLRLETVALLNAAFCDYHLRHCGPTQQLYDVCTEALSLFVDIQDELNVVEPQLSCINLQANCDSWAKSGACSDNYIYMKWNCPKACKWCYYGTEAQKTPRKHPTSTLQLLNDLKHILAAEEVGEDDHILAAVRDGSASLPVVNPGGQAAGDAAAAQHKREVARALLFRCYRMKKLTAAQVKECAAAASRGEMWAAGKDMSDDSSRGSRHTGHDRTGTGSTGQQQQQARQGHEGLQAAHAAGASQGVAVLSHPLVLACIGLLAAAAFYAARKGMGARRRRRTRDE